MPELQMLEEAAVIFVCREQILAEEPSPIGRHIVHGIKLIAHKTRGHESNTFLRELCAHGVHVAKRWCQPIEAVTTLGRALNPSLLIVASRRGWRHHLPSERNSMLRIGSEQGVQECGAAAWQANNKKWFADFLQRNTRIKLSIPFHQQTRTQCA